MNEVFLTVRSHSLAVEGNLWRHWACVLVYRSKTSCQYLQRDCCHLLCPLCLPDAYLPTFTFGHSKLYLWSLVTNTAAGLFSNSFASSSYAGVALHSGGLPVCQMGRPDLLDVPHLKSVLCHPRLQSLARPLNDPLLPTC